MLCVSRLDTIKTDRFESTYHSVRTSPGMLITNWGIKLRIACSAAWIAPATLSRRLFRRSRADLGTSSHMP